MDESFVKLRCLEMAIETCKNFSVGTWSSHPLDDIISTAKKYADLVLAEK